MMKYKIIKTRAIAITLCTLLLSAVLAEAAGPTEVSIPPKTAENPGGITSQNANDFTDQFKITHERLQADKFMSNPLYKPFKPQRLTLSDSTTGLQEAHVRAIDMMGGIPNPLGKMSARSIINDSTVPDTGYFGDGSDGPLYIRAGQTVVLPVAVPDQSIVQKNYTNVTIEYGGTLKCSAPNAGLILRVQGDCNILGTIDQRAMAPVTNPNNLYSYPPELRCGRGGDGGGLFGTSVSVNDGQLPPQDRVRFLGGRSMPARKYGGGFSGGGAGHTVDSNYLMTHAGAAHPNWPSGGNADAMDIMSQDLFKGGQPFSSSATGKYGIAGNPGINGGGGGGYLYASEQPAQSSGGGTGAGADGSRTIYIPRYNGKIIWGGSGGAGNRGGGVILIYCKNLAVGTSGRLDCRGGNGGKYSQAYHWHSYEYGGPDGEGSTNWGEFEQASGACGGGAGGGGLFISRVGGAAPDLTNSTLGGLGGNPFTDPRPGYGHTYYAGTVSENGSSGTITLKQAPPEKLPHKITCQSAASGSITTSKNNAPAGTWVSINIYPASGYKFTPESLRLNGQPISGSGFNMPAYDVTVSASFELADSTGPSMSVTTQQTWNSYSNTATISASDPSGVAGYSMDNTSSWTGNNVFTFYSNGGHTVYTKDGNGNISSARFNIDHIDSNDPMVGTVTSVGGNGWIADGPRAVDVSASDVGSGVASYAIKSDHNWGNGFQPSNRFYLAAGNYFVRVQDHAGRMSSEFPITVNNIDTEKPRVDSVKLLPEGWTTQSDKQLVITASDSQSGLAEFGISNDGAKWTWQTGNSFVKPKGKYQIQVKDKVGKLSLIQEVDVSGIDVLPPVINDVEIPVEWGRTATVKVIAVDEGAGVKDYTVTSGRTPAEEDFKPSNEFVITQNGEYWAWARDKLGQRSLGKKFNVTKIDTQPPGMGEIAVGAPYGNMLEFSLKSGTDFGASSGVHLQIQRNNEPEESLGVEAKVYVSYGDSWKVWTQDGVGNKSEVQWIYSQAPTAVPVLGWWKQLARVRFANGKQYCEKDSGSVGSTAVPIDASRRVFGIKDGVTTPVQGVAGADQQVSNKGATSVLGLTWLNDKDGVLAHFGDYTLESEAGNLVLKGKVSKQEICSHKPEQMVDLLIMHKLGEKLFEIRVDGVVQGVQTPTVPVGNDYLDFLQSGVGLANAQLWEVTKEATGESGIISVIPNSCVTQMLHDGVVISNREGATPITKAGNYSWEIKSSAKGEGVAVRYTLPAAVPTTPDVSCETEKQGVITPPVE